MPDTHSTCGDPPHTCLPGHSVALLLTLGVIVVPALALAWGARPTRHLGRPTHDPHCTKTTSAKDRQERPSPSLSTWNGGNDDHHDR